MPPRRQRQRQRGPGQRLLLLLTALLLPMALAFVVPAPLTCGPSTPAVGAGLLAQQPPPCGGGLSRAERPLSLPPLWSGYYDAEKRPSTPGSSGNHEAAAARRGKGVERRGAVGRGALLLALSTCQRV